MSSHFVVLATLALAILFSPLHRRLQRRMPRRRNLAAFVTLCICLVIVILPMALIGLSLVQEASVAYERVRSGQLNYGAYLQQMLADPPRVFRLAEPVTEHQRRFIAADQRHQRLGIQKLLLHKLAEIVADPVFIARDNRRMARDKGNRHPAEQRNHGKPVCQRADHRRLGNGLHAAHPEGLRQEQGGDKGRGGNQQQRQRQQLGAFEFSYFFHGLRIEGDGKKMQKSPQHPPTKPHQHHARRAFNPPERTAELLLHRSQPH